MIVKNVSNQGGANSVTAAPWLEISAEATKLRRIFTCIISFDLSTTISKSVPNHATKITFTLHAVSFEKIHVLALPCKQVIHPYVERQD